MPHVLKFATLAVLLAMSSACARPVTPKSVSDLCLNDRRISVAPAPDAGQDDPGNALDSEQTVGEVLEHNAVVDRLCPVSGGNGAQESKPAPG